MNYPLILVVLLLKALIPSPQSGKQPIHSHSLSVLRSPLADRSLNSLIRLPKSAYALKFIVDLK